MAKVNQTIPLISNIASIQFLRQASSMLDLPIRTTATAVIYYHRFKTFMDNREKTIFLDGALTEEEVLYRNEELLTTTCLQLACKATEVPRKVRDLVNVGYRYYHPKGSTLNIDENYFKMRSSLVTSELLLVRALGFDLEVELPFAYCLNVLRGLGSIRYFVADERRSKRHPYPAPKEIWKRMENDMESETSAIARLAWVYVWDSLCSPKIALTHSIPSIGLGCLYLALQSTETEMPMSMNEYVDMWGASENISVQAVRDVIMDLLDFYDHFPSDTLSTPNTKLPPKPLIKS
ncbi:Cyclin-related protein FAM58A [Choanephora cucurbitarum]|uniref:Cyclin-related protein FAM58A n=1 Tax=Choanephora cucurbitarum TaxID=101091 RepID=A0A1C7N9R5_9FUNG|nr:Cyclin-related protein FAM58A [Choanephora cucurbitarum]